MNNTLTEKKIQQVLNKFMPSPKYNVDGLFVFRWESDKLMWTKAGYIYEFEIKISRADYKNDFKHKIEKHLLLNSKLKEPSEQLQQTLFDNLLKLKQKRYPNITMDQVKKECICHLPENTRLPNFFYYVVPVGMLKPDEVPPYAGLIYINTDKEPKHYRGKPDKWIYNFSIMRPAPKLHKTKYTDAELNLSEKFYYNWQTTKQALRNAEENTEYYKTQLEYEIKSKGHEYSWDELKSKLSNFEMSADHWKALYLMMVDGADYNSIERRMLIQKIKALNPSFDYSAFMKEVDKKYEEKGGSAQL